MFIKININIFKGCIPKSSRKEDDIYRRSAFRNRTGNETIKCYKKNLVLIQKIKLLPTNIFLFKKLYHLEKKTIIIFLKRKKFLES